MSPEEQHAWRWAIMVVIIVGLLLMGMRYATSIIEQLYPTGI